MGNVAFANQEPAGIGIISCKPRNKSVLSGCSMAIDVFRLRNGKVQGDARRCHFRAVFPRPFGICSIQVADAFVGCPKFFLEEQKLIHIY